jgi:homoisocitrate dehydrogenase
MMADTTYCICLLPGDGIGPEVVASATEVLRSLPLAFEFSQAEIGFGAYQKLGTPLPQATLDAIRASDAALFGAVTTPPNIEGYFSPVVRLRQTLDLYTNLRPIRSIPHPSSREGIDILIVRENSEGLYIGSERVEENGERAVTERIITRRGSERILRKAFELARAGGGKQVHVVHKANVLRQTCGLFRAVALEVAHEYPDIAMKEMLVDTCAMELVRDPQQFELIVTTNLFGDILSDEACMLVGGLGVAASGNIGADVAVFEPVHGSAPALAGTGQANPLAAILAAAMLLEHIGEAEQAGRVRAAAEACMAAGEVTADMGGSLSTSEATQAVIHNLK